MRISVALATVCFVLPLASPASAAPILLDQQYAPITGTGSLNVQIDQSVAQSFTVGLDGILSSVEVQLARGNPAPAAGITLAIVDAPGGTPNLSAVLASAFINPSQVATSYSFVSVDLSAAMLEVTSGQRLAIYLTSQAPNGSGINPYAWFGDAAGLYLGGAGYVGSSATLRDFGFRMYVDREQLSSVPEPTAILLLGTGLLGAGVRRWRQRRS